MITKTSKFFPFHNVFRTTPVTLRKENFIYIEKKKIYFYLGKDQDNSIAK
jgi:hypothetical protein